MRTLSHIALSNFIIPSLFSIAQLVVVYRNVDVLIVNEIVLVNTMLAVFGVVFATVWAGNVGRRAAQIEDTSRTDDDVVARRHPRAFAFPGLGTWRVASSPPTLPFGSTEYTVPTEGVGLITRDSEKVNNGGMSSLKWVRAGRSCCSTRGFRSFDWRGCYGGAGFSGDESG